MKGTRPAPVWKQGSIKNENISMMEQIEYRQTGMIKVKDTALSRGELRRLSEHKDISYYDWIDKHDRLTDFFNGF